MKLLSVVHDEWSAALTDRLAAGDLVCAVAVVGPAAKAWDRYQAARQLARLDETAPHHAVSGVDHVLVVGQPDVPPRLSAAVPAVPWLVVTGGCEEGIAVSDPIYWSIRTNRPEVWIWLQLADPELRRKGTPAVARVDVAGRSYPAGVDAVARSLAELLRISRLDPEPPPAAPDLLPVTRQALRIDWTRSNEEVSRLVRAGAGRAAPAWTYLSGFPVAVGGAESVDAEASTLAPGTIVRRAANGVTVATGSGEVQVSGVRDAIGPLPDILLRPGLRFGTDADEELRQLSRRVADLERMLAVILAEGSG
jgi:hypothetical protein